MFFLRFILGTVMFILTASPAWAARAPLMKDELRNGADRIVIGEVKSYRLQTRPAHDGEERTQVYLSVVVEAVEKDGQPATQIGQTVAIDCWKLTRRVSPYTDIGQLHIPGVGSRARFYVKGNSAMHPNGIEMLEGAELKLPIVYAAESEVETDTETSSPAVFDGRLVILLVSAMALVTLVIVIFYKRAKAKHGAVEPDR
jgi:hypothetical protein